MNNVLKRFFTFAANINLRLPQSAIDVCGKRKLYFAANVKTASGIL